LERSTDVARITFLLAAIVALLGASGCTNTGLFLTQLAGIVTDANGDPVRNAQVTAGSRTTQTNSGGAYVIDRLPEGTHVVRASITSQGVTFSGRQVVSVFRGERSKSANITVVRTDQQARMYGTVRDRFGSRIAGARVFAYAGTLSSNVSITNSNGDYDLRELMSGVTYEVSASARTYDNDNSVVLLSAGEARQFDFVLNDESNSSLPAPTNLFAVAWTTPYEVTRTPETDRAYEAIKDYLKPERGRRMASGRLTPGGYHVEADLFWDPVSSTTLENLLGYGIYRATTALGASVAVDFLRDPYATFFADIDDNLREGRTYYYEITALNTSYPDTQNSESGFSNRYGVETLGELALLQPTLSPLTFRWLAAVGTTEYAVYLFDSYPGIAVTPVWSSFATSGTSMQYDGSQLQAGKRYYYLVVGSANGGESLTLSRIGDFVAN